MANNEKKKEKNLKNVSLPIYRLISTQWVHLILTSALLNFVTHFIYRQLDFSSEPGVANEILENEPKSCLKVA